VQLRVDRSGGLITTRPRRWPDRASRDSPGYEERENWGTSVEDSRQKRQRKKRRLKRGQLKNGNGRNGKRKVGQLEKSATKSERVGEQGNKKLMCVITATEKGQQKKTATGKWATENWATRKFGNEK